MVDAYLNFLQGKGSGTGWDLEHEVQLAASRIYSKTPTVFDVGANVGNWSLGLLELLPAAHLYLFEPSPECQREIRGLNLESAELIPSAVGETTGRAKLYFSSGTDGEASLHPRGDSYFRDRVYQTVEVDVVTLDQVIASRRLAFVDFIKMDIEGHELSALKGAERALKDRKIGALSFEFGSGNINSRTFFRDLWNLLTSAGFVIWRITPGGRLLHLPDYYEDCEYYRGATNYIAELKEHPARRSPPAPAAA